jgi:hypothetical protein
LRAERIGNRRQIHGSCVYLAFTHVKVRRNERGRLCKRSTASRLAVSTVADVGNVVAEWQPHLAIVNMDQAGAQVMAHGHPGSSTSSLLS